MRVCSRLDIPFLECDAEEVYKNGVADYMIEEYKKGNTPNPDVMCNREVKFGVFWQFAKERGADFIATGHYARVELLHENSSFQSSLTPFLAVPRNGTPPPVASQGLFSLRKSNDSLKDQSYFLWTLTQDDLSHTLFPVGHLQKSQVRKLADKYNLPTATKKDSQGVCFLGPLDMKDFLAHYIKSKRGDVLDEKGKVIGYHDGAVFFTLGERHGFTITKHSTENAPLYVVAKDINKNTITVSTKQQGEKNESTTYNLTQINWISEKPEENRKYTAQIRYHGEQLSCKVKGSTIIFSKPILVSAGQSIVVYDKDVCIGGGVVI
jgi:tRNA-specific 2-thiouridylase